MCNINLASHFFHGSLKMPYCRNEQRFASLLPTPSFFVKSLWLCMKGFYSLVLFQVNFFNSLISNISILNIFSISKSFFFKFLKCFSDHFFFKILLFFKDANIIQIDVFKFKKRFKKCSCWVSGWTWRSNKKVSNFHLLDSLFLGVGIVICLLVLSYCFFFFDAVANSISGRENVGM